MGIGLLIAGRTSSDAAAVLEPLEAWFRERCAGSVEFAARGRDENERPCLFLRLHPGAEDVEIAAAAPDRLVVSAKTSTVGPGYHRYLCTVLQEAAPFHGIEWLPAAEVEETGDDTGFFHSGAAEDVDAHMRGWLGGLAEQVLEVAKDGGTSIGVSMPLGRQYEAAEAALTPMGPRSTAWFEAVAADPARGFDIFPWRFDGHGADYELGRALVRIWLEVAWRPPVDDEERALLRDVAERLAAAHALDPSLAYPWREWKEILAHLGDPPKPEVEAGAAGARGPRAGYRRHPVRVSLPGGWSIRIPGSFKEATEDDGRWSAWEPGRTVWFTSFSFVGKDGSPPDPARILADFDPAPGEPVPAAEGGLPAVASFGETEEDGRALWRLEGRVALPGQLGVFDAFLEDKADRDWAVEVWRSIRRPR